jgi:hypothetical protein
MDPPKEATPDELDMLSMTHLRNPSDTEAEANLTNETTVERRSSNPTACSTTPMLSAIPSDQNNDSNPVIENPSNPADDSCEDALMNTSFVKTSESLAQNDSTLRPESGIYGTAHHARCSQATLSVVIPSETPHTDDDSKPAALDSPRKTNGGRYNAISIITPVLPCTPYL